MRFDAVVQGLAALPEPLPPPLDALLPVRLDMADGRPIPRPPSGDALGRPAAVLVLLFPDEAGDTRIVLIERPTHDGRHHSGEVSFPGGKAEPEDANAIATALREAEEEVGLDVRSSGVKVIGLLDGLWIPVSDFAVTPVLAIAERRPVLVASPDEVVRIIEPLVEAFLPDAPVVTVERTVRGWSLRYGQYEVDGLAVWGATARILSQLGGLLAMVGSPTA